MSNLFIIGNGFDLAHGLKTSYDHFKKYLMRTHDIYDQYEFIQPQLELNYDHDYSVSDSVAAQYLLKIISDTEGEKWQDIESTVSDLEYSEYFDQEYYGRDEEGDIDFFPMVYTNEDISSALLDATTKIHDFFKDWVEDIRFKKKTRPIKKFIDIIDKDKDLFLSFNYTHTLEILYEINNICHIHGQKGGKIYFGHGNDEDFNDKYMELYTGSETNLCSIKKYLRKDTIDALNKNLGFFNQINGEIEKVYSFGFSYSDVDRVYIEKICQKLNNKDIVWYLNEYDDINERNKYMDIINKCGYKGKFDTFIV